MRKQIALAASRRPSAALLSMPVSQQAGIIAVCIPVKGRPYPYGRYAPYGYALRKPAKLVNGYGAHAPPFGQQPARPAAAVRSLTQPEEPF